MKQAIIVPRWLKMSPGKVASQCCHAALTAGNLDDKRVILGADSPALIAILAKLATRIAGIEWGYFQDEGPTTEGTDGVITVYWVRGEDGLVNYLTGDMELY